MNTMIETPVEVKEWVLKATDRCDSCAAEALVQVIGLNGELLFVVIIITRSWTTQSVMKK
jgi:hypothetical protein